VAVQAVMVLLFFAALEWRYQWNFDLRCVESVGREAQPEVVGSIFKIMMIVICY
jgi:hypothetical protein